MSKHTRGNWVAICARVEHEDDDVADICTCDTAAFGQEHLGRTHQEMWANANLMAAAPDLLKAVRGLLKMPDFDGTKETSMARMAARRAARAAIAKAEGKA